MRRPALTFALAVAASALVLTAASDGVSGGAPIPSVSAVAIDAGLIHTCALTGAGGVRCWGDNTYLELGDAAIGYRTTPGAVAGLSSVTAIAVGQRHGCALTRAGGVKCWGQNRYGQLGNGTTAPSSRLVDVLGLSSGVSAITAGFHTCALTSVGAVKCWGANTYGQVGDGTTEDRSTPADVVGLSSGVTALAAGDSHTCALTSSGGVKCWGDNSAGQLGDGTSVDRWTPVDVSGLTSGVAGLAAGGLHTCVVTAAGHVRCWGDNADGQLGDGTTKERLRPVPVSSLRVGVTAVVAGLRHTCALTRRGGVRCWGLNDHGQLGDGTNQARSRPVAVAGLAGGVVALAAGGLHSCALLVSRGASCWGDNVYGQLGDASEVDRRRPVRVVGLGPPRAEVAVVSHDVRVTHARTAAVELRCGRAVGCRGRLALAATVRGRLVGSARRRVALTLGARRFAVAALRSKTIEVRLTTTASQLLARVKRLPAEARLRYAQPDGSTTMTTRTIVLIAPRAPAP